MNKKNKKTAFLGFLVACAGAYGVYASRDDDPRATDFAKYIAANIDSIVASHMTEQEIQEYVESYRQDPAAYEMWLNHLVENAKYFNRDLIKDAAVIHKLDSAAGRKLAFAEALRRVKALPDTAPKPSNEIMLQRNINAKTDTDINIALSRAAMKKVKSGK